MALTVLDAGTVIAVLSSRDTHHVAARREVSSSLREGHELVLPASAYAEILVEPHERGLAAVRQVDAFLAALPARIEGIDAKVAKAAARLRARHRTLKLPGAMVIATAELLKADQVLTTDSGWPSGVGVVIHIVGRGRVRIGDRRRR